MQIFFLQYNFFSTQKTVVAYGILLYCARGATLNVHQFIYMSTREVKGKWVILFLATREVWRRCPFCCWYDGILWGRCSAPCRATTPMSSRGCTFRLWLVLNQWVQRWSCSLERMRVGTAALRLYLTIRWPLPPASLSPAGQLMSSQEQLPLRDGSSFRIYLVNANIEMCVHFIYRNEGSMW
jgi:hypothetical protein